MNLDLKTIPAQLASLLEKTKKYAVFSFIIITLGLVGYLVARVNQLSRLEPSEDAALEKIEAVPRPRVDQDVVNRIVELRDQNVQVETLFKDARNNPFKE